MLFKQIYASLNWLENSQNRISVTLSRFNLHLCFKWSAHLEFTHIDAFYAGFCDHSHLLYALNTAMRNQRHLLVKRVLRHQCLSGCLRTKCLNNPVTSALNINFKNRKNCPRKMSIGGNSRSIKRKTYCNIATDWVNFVQNNLNSSKKQRTLSKNPLWKIE